MGHRILWYFFLVAGLSHRILMIFFVNGTGNRILLYFLVVGWVVVLYFFLWLG